MENAAEALKLAAWVLLFVVALSICINSFSEARQTMDTILEYNDKEYSYTYVEEQDGQTQRVVGAESIIPAIYRAYKENYKIIFPEDYDLYTKTEGNERKAVNFIDLEREHIGNQKQAEEFVKAILYGKNDIGINMTFPNITFHKPNTDDTLYKKLQGKQYIEKLGEYYQDEIGIESTEENSISDANKTKKRVITYEEAR